MLKFYNHSCFISVKYPKPVCTYHTLKSCFPSRKQLFLEFQEINEITNKIEKVKCNCLQNCVDSNIIVEKTQRLTGTKGLLGSTGALVMMKRYPLYRFQREVLFTLTDLFGK